MGMKYRYRTDSDAGHHGDNVKTFTAISNAPFNVLFMTVSVNRPLV